MLFLKLLEFLLLITKVKQYLLRLNAGVLIPQAKVPVYPEAPTVQDTFLRESESEATTHTHILNRGVGLLFFWETDLLGVLPLIIQLSIAELVVIGMAPGVQVESFGQFVVLLLVVEGADELFMVIIYLECK